MTQGDMMTTAILRNVNAMKLDDVLNIEGRKVIRVRQANGNLVWTVEGWVFANLAGTRATFRSAERVISWINWDKKQQSKFGRKDGNNNE